MYPHDIFPDCETKTGTVPQLRYNLCLCQLKSLCSIYSSSHATGKLVSTCLALNNDRFLRSPNLVI